MDINYYNTLTTPLFALASIQEDALRSDYVKRFYALPDKIWRFLLSDRAAAFIRGLGKQFRLSQEKTVELALLILRVSLGEVRLSALSQAIQTDLGLPAEAARKLSVEIERDLLAPYIVELNAYFSQQKPQPVLRASAPKPSTPTSPPNILDLKKPRPAPPKPPAPFAY